jgi:maltoporin
VANDVELWNNGGKGDASTASASAKVTYHWSDYTRTYLEMGYFEDKKTVDGIDSDRSGAKYTLAQALSYGRDKPELRVFVSHYDSDKDNWDDNTQSFNNDLTNDTWAVGIQANVFW